MVVFLATVYFGGRIVYSAIPYHGALSWRIDAWRRQKHVLLEHDNLFEDGADGFLTDLDTALSLPLDTVTELPALGQSLGFTSDDYDYYEMPEQDGDELFVLAITEKGEKSGLLFKSADQGVTWTFYSLYF